jgi:hypothetical protein
LDPYAVKVDSRVIFTVENLELKTRRADTSGLFTPIHTSAWHALSPASTDFGGPNGTLAGPGKCANGRFPISRTCGYPWLSTSIPRHILSLLHHASPPTSSFHRFSWYSVLFAPRCLVHSLTSTTSNPNATAIEKRLIHQNGYDSPWSNPEISHAYVYGTISSETILQTIHI